MMHAPIGELHSSAGSGLICQPSGSRYLILAIWVQLAHNPEHEHDREVSRISRSSNAKFLKPALHYTAGQQVRPGAPAKADADKLLTRTTSFAIVLLHAQRFVLEHR